MTFPPIQDLLPHEPPMLWIDEVIHREGDLVQCTLTIREDHVFVEDGRVEPLVSVEWMAQTVGALVGLYDRAQDLAPRPGYLIAIPEASFDVASFEVGDRLLIEAKRVWGDDELASFECRVFRLRPDARAATEHEGVKVARGQLSVYRRALPGSEQS